ncbi:YjbH domain-containing protein [Veronia pacifica]|uniref:WbfB protein n=1 Tax=Veronia pacifica TaxID=1080227 RepID=A0A1C3ERA7_9GAMM|nr:YjbH domain-containing protein [Veronia pacifica]ODA35756.1 hypothetical protein A8L45_01575 [Veronia pacifica]
MKSYQKSLSQLITLCLVSLPALAVSADHRYFEPSQTDFGGVGLMQMPTGRVARDGEFSFGLSFNADYEHYHASIQLLDRLEATLRYTLLPNRNYGSGSFGGDTKYTDKGIDFKFKLFDESFWVPETSVGVRDLGGTGLFDGEYIAATKRVGPIDITAGIAWGYMGNMANLRGSQTSSNKECGRVSEYGGKGGEFDIKRWFTGCASVYGGLEYQTPWRPLALKAEYDANDYTGDFAPLEQPPKSHINIGALYALGDWGRLRASFERGNIWTLGFTLRTNFNSLQQEWLNNPAPVYSPNTSRDWSEIARSLSKNAGYSDVSIYRDKQDILIYGKQTHYRNAGSGYERAATIIENAVTGASSFRIIDQSKGLSLTETIIDADKHKKYANQEQIGLTFDETVSAVQPPNPKNSPETEVLASNYEPFSYDFAPTLAQSLGSAEDFYLFSVGIAGNVLYRFNQNTELSAQVHLNLYNNYDKFSHTVAPGDSTQLKRVRTLVRNYLSDQPVRLNNLQLTQFDQLGDSVFGQFYAGYLESMFAGVGAEVLFRQHNSNWALGLNANYVKQRDPASQFGFFDTETYYDMRDKRNYRTQTGTVTGHGTFYYRPQWTWIEDLELKLSAGKYLAEDKGFTINISRQFKSGVKVGAFATKTNLSAEEFGEGSFNKGFYISIPLDTLMTHPTVNRSVISWIPLTRDGGQMLNTKYNLYDLTNQRYQKSEYSLAD